LPAVQVVERGGSVPAPAAPAEAPVAERYGRLPLSFEQNVGQTAEGVDFLARGAGYTLFLTPTEAGLALAPAAAPPPPLTGAGGGSPLRRGGYQGADAPRSPDVVVRMQVLGGNPAAAPVGAEALPTKVNYFLGNDRGQWHTDIPTFSRVEYQGVYPGIDLAY